MQRAGSIKIRLSQGVIKYAHDDQKNQRNDMNHYTYLLIHPDGLMYIGVRSCKCLPDEDTAYMSSAKTVSKEYLQECDKLVLGEFATREKAINEEIRLHDLLEVGINTSFFNRAKQTCTGFDRSGIAPWNKGKPNPLSEEGISNIRIATKARLERGSGNIKKANIFNYKTNELVAENVCLKQWADNNGYHQGNLAATARGKYKSCKGLYAKYV